MSPDARAQSQKSCGNADRGFLQASFGPTCDGEARNVRPEFSALVWLQRHSSRRVEAVSFPSVGNLTNEEKRQNITGTAIPRPINTLISVTFSMAG
jgi:hypothetical protein